MSIQYSAEIEYAGKNLTVTTDNFAQLHQALAGITNLNDDYRHLIENYNSNPEDIGFAHMEGNSDNGPYSYYKLVDTRQGISISFGTKQDQDALIPFFPKGDDGVYTGNGQGSGRSGGYNGGGGGGRQPSQPRRQQRAPNNQGGGQNSGQNGGGGQPQWGEAPPFAQNN
jgi:hypothetical protein